MISILNELAKNDSNIPSVYQQCIELWSEVLDHANECSVDDLADNLWCLQRKIECICNLDRDLGKSLMAITGFHYLYDDFIGYDHNSDVAIKLADAIEKSKVSVEVKVRAMKAAKEFGLNEYKSLN